MAVAVLGCGRSPDAGTHVGSDAPAAADGGVAAPSRVEPSRVERGGSVPGVVGEGEDRGAVVLYSSVDGYVLEDLIAAFEAETGQRVEVVGDTEATKTTGLVERLLTERGSPTAHVWWSSEPFGSIKLAREGVLAPFDPPVGDALPGGWPASLRDEGGRWHGFGLRARVIAFHADAVGVDEAPAGLWRLADPVWRGRVGMARPQFGTTRGHLAALAAAWGPAALEEWLKALKENGVRLYDGNATVVRAIRDGEIDVGLTDSDDVHHAQRNGWPIGMVLEARTGRPDELGPLLLPNTAGLIARPDTPEGARALLAWILSPRAERLLAASDSKNFPIFPQVAAEHPTLSAPEGWRPDLAEAADHAAEAMEIARRVLGP